MAIPWFADDLATVGNLNDCALALEFLIKQGPKYGYFPEPEQTHVILHRGIRTRGKLGIPGQGLDASFITT